MESYVLSSLLVCLAACLWCLFYWRPHRRMWELMAEIPGPKGYPLIGNVFLFTRQRTKILPLVTQLFADYGPIVRLWMGPYPIILMNDPDDIQVIYGNPRIRNRPEIPTAFVAKLTGEGLMTARGDKWKQHRKLLNPAFSYQILDNYVEVFGKKSQVFVKKIEEFGEKSFNVYHPLALFALDSICETSIGTAIDCQEAGRSDFLDGFDQIYEIVYICCSHPWLWVPWIFALSPTSRRSKPLIETIHAFSESVISKNLDEYRSGIRAPSITTASNKRVSSFLDMVIEASESQGSILSHEEIRDEVTALAIAGVFTTTSVISFGLVLIAMHTEIQAELHRELDEVFGSDDRPATVEDLKQLPFLARCMKETLRLFPTAPFSARDVYEDVPLPSGYTIPAGSTIVMFPLTTQRDPSNFVDPEKFWPDRWLPENCKDLHTYAYLPFSAGPRNCIGKGYAQLQFKSVMSQLLRLHRLSTPLTMESLQTLSIVLSLTIDPELEGQYCIQLHKR